MFILQLYKGADGKDMTAKACNWVSIIPLFTLHIYFTHNVSFTREGLICVDPGFGVFYLHMDWKYLGLTAV